jgi:hypothetical protein
MKRECLNPKCCGSDGIDCCIPECDWSPWRWIVDLIRREIRRASC